MWLDDKHISTIIAPSENETNYCILLYSYLDLKLRIDGSRHTDVFLAGAVAMVNRNFGALLIMTFHSHGARA